MIQDGPGETASTADIALAVNLFSKIEENMPASLAEAFKKKRPQYKKLLDVLRAGESQKAAVLKLIETLKGELKAVVEENKAIAKTKPAKAQEDEASESDDEDDDTLTLNAKVTDDGDCEEVAKALGVKSEFDKLLTKLKQTNPVKPKHLGCYWEKNLSTEGSHPSLFFKFMREKDGTATLVLDAIGVHANDNNKYYRTDKKGKATKSQLKTQAKWSG